MLKKALFRYKRSNSKIELDKLRRGGHKESIHQSALRRRIVLDYTTVSEICQLCLIGDSRAPLESCSGLV